MAWRTASVWVLWAVGMADLLSVAGVVATIA
jgi:hypothetical protein